MGMDVMDAPNIRWAALAQHGDEPGENGTGDEPHDEEGEYDFETFRLAVIEGRHPDGESLGNDMPLWDITPEDLRDLADYLESLSSP